MNTELLIKIGVTIAASALGALGAWAIMNWMPSTVTMVVAVLCGFVAWKYIKI